MSRWATSMVLWLSVVATITCRVAASDASLVNRPDLPRVTQLEANLWQDLCDGALDDHSLLQAAMIAGGCGQQAALDEGQAVFDAFCRAQAVSLASCATASQRAELLFRGMHETLLTGSFQEHCYRLDHTLAGQAYNCLTSTILYLCLCRQCGVAAVAEAGPTHVFCRLSGDVAREIETTREIHTIQADFWARSWRGANGTLPGKPRQEGEQTLSIPPSRVRDLDDVGLMARVYYNRGTSLLLQNEYRRATQCLERCCQLDPSHEAARRNRITAWNAWALELCDQERFSDAVDVLANCLHFAPEEPATLQNDLHIHHRWTLALCQQHRFPEALQLLDSGYARQPQAEFYDEGRWSVIEAWASWELQHGGISSAAQVFTSARERYADARRLGDYESQFWLDYLDRLQREGRQAMAESIRRSLRSSGSHLTGRDL